MPDPDSAPPAPRPPAGPPSPPGPASHTATSAFHAAHTRSFGLSPRQRQRLRLRRQWLRRLSMGLALLPAALAALVAWQMRPPVDTPSPARPGAQAQTPSNPPAADTLARGAYLARVGNCAGCHTARGGAPYAGGRPLATPFGTAYAGNLTPDRATGLGDWSADDFWRALHHGRGRDGRLLLPVFPYTAFTRMPRADSDALYAWLRTLPPVARPATPQALRWPYGSLPALALWRTLYFRPGVWQDDPAHSAAWNRGAYLVQGPGHCAECHAPRNALGAITDGAGLTGGLMAAQRWWAPALGLGPAVSQAAMADETAPLTPDDVIALLHSGQSARGTANGPMAEVVFGSTQYWTAADLQATATYLASLPAPAAAPSPATAPLPAAQQAAGAELYRQHCADCHGPRGEGAAGAYPPLAGNPTVTAPWPGNLVQAILHGGFAPATAAHPRPYGMPPQALSDAELATLATWLRQAFGNQASAVSELDVLHLR